MKKLLSITLALLLTVGLLIPASAASITVGLAQSVTVVNDETPVVFQFIPAKSGYYVFYSYNSTGYDPYGYIMDGDKKLLADGDDTENGMDFSIVCYMTAGKTYYLAATCYEGSARYTVQIHAMPSPTAITFDRDRYVGSICGSVYPQITFYPADCAQETITLSSSNEQVVSIGESGDFCFGIPGTATVTATSASGLTATCTVTVELPPSLVPDTPWTLDAALGEQYLSFTAPSDGWYGIHSEGDEIDPSVEILDAKLNGLNADDKTLANDNFFAPVYLKANQTCYFGLLCHNNTGTAAVTLQKLNQATALQLPHNRITGYPDTGCYLMPVYVPQISIPEELTWTSSDENVAYVDGNGSVRFLKPGNAVITVTSETGKTDSVAVTVLPAPTDSDLLDWGICGANLQWQLNQAGTLTITGSGDMYDLYNNDYHWDGYSDRITRVIFPDGITGIGYGAFLECTELTELEIPHSVRHIGGSAFSDCYALTRITLPDRLESLGQEVFDYCIALKQVNLPQGLKRLPGFTFQSCIALSQITLPQSLVSIGDQAFAGCAIDAIELPASLKTIGFSAFANTGLTQVRLPDGLTQIRDYAFANCSLVELTIPATVTQLGCGFITGNKIHTVRFLGNAPVLDNEALNDVRATAYYPAGNRSWTDVILQNYGGTVTWVAEGHPGVTLGGSINKGVTLTLSLEQQVLQTLTAETDSYEFSNLQPGTYTLTATAVNHVMRTCTIILTDQAQHLDITLHLIGDVDGNGKVNIGDVAKINAHIKNTAALTDPYMLECANVNGGKLNMGDSASLYAHIRGTKKLY